MENIVLNTADGFTLDADYFPGKCAKGVIFAHGASVSRDKEPSFISAAKILAEKGFHVLLFDFRGHGKSSGDSAKDFSISGALLDLITAADFLKENGAAILGLAGNSFGASIISLLVLTGRDDLVAILFINPVLNYRTCFFEPTTASSRYFFSSVHKTLETEEHFQMPDRDFRLGRRVFAEMKIAEYDPIAALTKYDGPLLVLHGDADTDVSHDDVAHFVSTLPNMHKSFVTIAGGRHGLRDEPALTETLTHVVDFFSHELGV